MADRGVLVAASTAALLMGVAAGTGPKTTSQIPAVLTGTVSSSGIEVLGPRTVPSRWLNEPAGRRIFLTLRKRGPGGDVNAHHTLTDRWGQRVGLEIAPSQVHIAADTITAFEFTLTGKADTHARYSGDLLLSLAGADPATNPPAVVPLTITPSAASPSVDQVLGLGVLLTFVSVAFGATAALCKFGAVVPMDPLSWSTDSWATNTAIASSVLTALAVLLAPQDLRARLAQEDYRYLMAVFALPAAMAPVLFTLVRRPKDLAAGKGISLGYVVASAATLLAAQTQTVLLLAMVDDLLRAVVFTAALAWALKVIVVLVAAALVVYGNAGIYVAIRAAVKAAPPPPPTGQPLAAAKATLL